MNENQYIEKRVKTKILSGGSRMAAPQLIDEILKGREANESAGIVFLLFFMFFIIAVVVLWIMRSSTD